MNYRSLHQVTKQISTLYSLFSCVLLPAFAQQTSRIIIEQSTDQLVWHPMPIAANMIYPTGEINHNTDQISRMYRLKIQTSDTPATSVSPAFTPLSGNLIKLEESDDLMAWQKVILNHTMLEVSGNIRLAASFSKRFYRLVYTVHPSTPEFALIPAGTFQRGDHFSEGNVAESPVHTVNISPFYIGKYEVTKELWNSVRDWGLQNGYSDLPEGGAKAANHPVQTITWFAMVKWCNARSEREGLTHSYTINGNPYKVGIENAVVCNWNANGYRLPSEAEWEKAARGGLVGKRFPLGDLISHDQANYYAQSNISYDASGALDDYHPIYKMDQFPYTSPVGSFAPNGYGLYDMAGNVREWLWDFHNRDYYATSPAIDPRGPTTGSNRSVRGGGWSTNAYVCRVADRSNRNPGLSNSEVGFRIARRASF